MNYDVLKKNFEKHGFHTAYFETGEEAASYIKEMVKGKAVALGGSVTLQEIKLNEVLDGECALTWHWLEPGAETLKKAAVLTGYPRQGRSSILTGPATVSP